MAKVAKSKEEKLRQQLQALFALMGSSNLSEREAARQKIDELLARHRKTWADLTELLKQPTTVDPWQAAWDDTKSNEQHAGDALNRGLPVEALREPPNVLQLVHHILARHNGMQPHEHIAAALWVLHSHVFRSFGITPRLALISPIRGCGKTTALLVIEQLACRPERMDNTTPAVIYHLVDRSDGATLLIDEADNLGLGQNGILRAVFNSGYMRGGNVRRVIRGTDKKFSTYAPMAIAAIGSLPLPMMRRSIIIHMQKAVVGSVERFDMNNPETVARINSVFGFVSRWARSKPALNTNPDLPKLNASAADNWRPLISIADSFGPEWGRIAREAAVTFARGFHDEDVAVVLLADIKAIFNRTGADRIFSEDLVAMLLEIEESGWADYRGMHDDRYPRKLNKEELARLLKLFRIRPRTVWPLKRQKGDRSRKGYYRQDFEAAWSAYVDDQPGTASQRNEIRLISSRSD